MKVYGIDKMKERRELKFEKRSTSQKLRSVLSS